MISEETKERVKSAMEFVVESSENIRESSDIIQMVQLVLKEEHYKEMREIFNQFVTHFAVKGKFSGF